MQSVNKRGDILFLIQAFPYPIQKIVTQSPIFLYFQVIEEFPFLYGLIVKIGGRYRSGVLNQLHPFFDGCFLILFAAKLNDQQIDFFRFVFSGQRFFQIRRVSDVERKERRQNEKDFFTLVYFFEQAVKTPV